MILGPSFSFSWSTNLALVSIFLRLFGALLLLINFVFFTDVMINSEFTPKRNRDIILDTYCDCPTKLPFNEILQDQKKPNKNLSREEWNAIMELKSQDGIIIKQSDKGGACVIMDKTYYYEKMMELLNDRETYQEINSNLDKQTHSKIKTLTKRYKHVLTEKECKYLTDFDYQDNNLYGLPKVHKSEEIITMDGVFFYLKD